MKTLFSLSELFRIFRWQDIVDILIVTYVLYRILLMIRGTKTVQMMLGMFVIAGGYYLAQQFELYIISWAIRNLLAYLVFAILIIFHPELRRLLQDYGVF